MPHHVHFELTVGPTLVVTVLTLEGPNILVEVHVSVQVGERTERFGTVTTRIEVFAIRT